MSVGLARAVDAVLARHHAGGTAHA